MSKFAQHIISALNEMTAHAREATATLSALTSVPDPFEGSLVSIDGSLDIARRTIERAGDEARMAMYSERGEVGS
jgi:hypothetical protein